MKEATHACAEKEEREKWKEKEGWGKREKWVLRCKMPGIYFQVRWKSHMLSGVLHSQPFIIHSPPRQWTREGSVFPIFCRLLHYSSASLFIIVPPLRAWVLNEIKECIHTSAVLAGQLGGRGRCIIACGVATSDRWPTGAQDSHWYTDTHSYRDTQKHTHTQGLRHGRALRCCLPLKWHSLEETFWENRAERKGCGGYRRERSKGSSKSPPILLLSARL